MEVFKLGNTYLKNVDLKNVRFELKIDDKELCFARLWGDGGLGNERCKRIIKNGTCFCKKHLEASQRMGGKWWLGLYNEERPEEPKHHISGIHKWSKDKNGNDYIKEVKNVEEDKLSKPVKVKRPRGRPKGSKNKK